MFKAPRGTKDILPTEQGYWKWITEKAAEICRLYGYQRIDTPVFEDAGLFLHSVGEETDIVEKQMYSFDDRGGDKITLRPEGHRAGLPGVHRAWPARPAAAGEAVLLRAHIPV